MGVDVNAEVLPRQQARSESSNRDAGRPRKDLPPIVRASERQTLFMAVRFRRGGQTTICDVVDLSEAGCRLRLSANFVDVGDTVFIKPDSLEALAGTVRWKNDHWMGIEFQQTVYRPVVDHLVRTSALT